MAVGRNKSPSNAMARSHLLPTVWSRSDRTTTLRMAEVTRKVPDLDPVQPEPPSKSHSVVESAPSTEAHLLITRLPTNDVGNFKATGGDNGGVFEEALQSYDFGAVRDFMKNNSHDGIHNPSI